MATLLPPPSKKAKLAQAEATQIDLSTVTENVLCQFRASDTGEVTGTTVRIPARTTAKELELLLNQLLQTNDDPVPYAFSLVTDNKTVDITENIYTNIIHPNHKTTEDLITLSYTPQAVFRVRAVTRLTGTISGHGAPILAASYSPKSSARLVTGSGDGTARMWDCLTSTPMATLEGHKNWVLCVAWSPDAKVIATGSMDNTLRLWDGLTGKPKGDALRGHSKWITSLAWEPLHLLPPSSRVSDGRVSGREDCRLASASKDTVIKVWDTVQHRPIFTLSGHTAAVTCLKWGGKNWIYSGSQDKSIRIWDGKDGKLIHVLSAHAHWVNTMSLSTDFVLRTGAFDHTGQIPGSFEQATKHALDRYRNARRAAGGDSERLISGSDDFTMYLWEPEKSTKPIARLTGHQKLINHVAFSPDGRLIASASFDNSVKLWDGRDGKFVATLRGHVAPVYQCSWSSDSRLLVSSSKDTTLKVWDVKSQKIKSDLPGHDDEVYAVDWAPDGQQVASGGKDKKVRLFGF